jgi:hypothetical protein
MGMVFEVGKCYRHTTGFEISIVAEIETVMYGSCLVAEDAYGELHPFGKREDNAVNYSEITKEEWMRNFKK